MKSQRILIGALTLGLLLAFAVGLSQAQELQSSPSAIHQPQQECPDKYEPNDAFKTAWPLSPGAISSYICCNWTDVDYFKFSVNAGDLIQLHLYDLPADYNLCLYGHDQKRMTCSTKPGISDETIEATASNSGTHYALIAGVEERACSSDDPYAFHLQVESQEGPDLVITDVWSEQGYYPQTKNICYQIRNVGDAVAPSGHYTFLSVDGSSVTSDLVYSDLAVGERLNRCFGSLWQCTLPQHTVNVCADGEAFVAESDETNNCRTETWTCDVTPPQITSGPVVSHIGQTTATVSWRTDEESDSMVEFGRYAAEYEDQESDATQSTEHEVLLTDLSPATVYHYAVRSTDASSNTVTSREGFFETAAPPTAAPDISSPTVARMEGERELYEIAVSVPDPLQTRKVEFYLDGRLIGTDYAAALSQGYQFNAAAAPADAAYQYQVQMDPAALKLSRVDFFNTQHTVVARAFSPSGLIEERSTAYMPPFEPPDIDLRVWPTHDQTRYVDGASGVLPAGSSVDISVHASEHEWDCSWVLGEVSCADVEHAVDRVVFRIGSTPVYTSYPSSDDDLEHEYSWDVSGLGVGTYQVAARAYARAGGSLTVIRTLSVEPGTPSLDLSRSVIREDDHFRVRLTLENEGTASAGISHVRDNVSGLQAIGTSTTNYAVVPEYSVESQHCDVEIDVFDGSDPLMLGPDESTTIEYLVVPILYADSDTFEYGAGVYDEVRIWDQGDFHRWRFDRPYALSAAVARARASSDYLIVTHPRNLYLNNPRQRSDVDELLSKMAELAQLKSGLLGYVSVWRADEIRTQIQAWGDGMRGSDGVDDHFLSNGYVLLVGEAEILGSWDSDHGSRRGTVHYTDLPYGNTSGDWVDPELIVGRVVGNNAQELTTLLQTSINVHRGEPNYHFTKSRALVVSGRGDGVSSFEANVDEVSRLLSSVGSPFAGGVTTKKQRYVEDTEGLDITWVFTSNIPTRGRDLIYYRNHCGAFGWGDGRTVIDTGHFPLDFGERKPFVFACCCRAGRYEALGAIGIAEAFLQNEAAVYIGATENSCVYQNNEASEWFFDRWVDRSESIGQSFKALKRHLDGRDGWYWAAEYNLYGDPKYGAVSTGAGLASRAEIAAAEPITSVSIVVPDYDVTSTLTGEHIVRIPGEAGGMLLEEGQPIVPVFYEEIEYAPGYRVQDVLLTARSGLTTATGLSIVVMSVATDSTVTASPTSSSGDGEEWWPPLGQVFDWSVRDNPDGSSTLVIKMYPFYYNSSTTNVQFYQNYNFTVEVISSSVQITSLATDENAYAQGDEVLVDLALDNAGDTLDGIVSAVVETQAGDVVDGLLLQSLRGLTGTASFSLQWESAGFEPGYYTIKAEVRDGSGDLLDREVEQFRVGVYAGEITAFTATPTHFDVGETISTSLVFTNTGTVPITGTANIQVQDDAGETVAAFSHEIADLTVGHSVSFDDTWDTTGAAEGAYTAIGYVLYDARATEIETVTVSTEAYIYLPLVLRDSQ